MKSLKIATILVLVLLGFANMTYAQQSSNEERAVAKTNEINDLIVSADASQALTDQQKEQVTNLYLLLFEETRKINKGEGAEEEKQAQLQALRKETQRQINQEILTKTQRQARQAAKKASEE